MQNFHSAFSLNFDLNDDVSRLSISYLPGIVEPYFGSRFYSSRNLYFQLLPLPDEVFF